MFGPDRKVSAAFSCYGFFYIKDCFIRFFDKRIFILNRKLPKSAGRKFFVDYLVITGNPAVTMDQIRNIFEVKEIIVDPSNSGRSSDEWKKEGAGKGLNVHVVNEAGAYVKEI